MWEEFGCSSPPPYDNMITNLIIMGKMVGCIRDEVFYTKRTSDHFFRIFGGFGASVRLLAELQKRDIEKFVILYELNKFECLVTDFYNYGKKYADKSSGIEDKQLILNIIHFKRGIQEERQEKLM